MSPEKRPPCPICGAKIPALPPGEPLPRHHPFCSARCQTIDLGNWLGGHYAIPAEPAEPIDEHAQDE